MYNFNITQLFLKEMTKMKSIEIPINYFYKECFQNYRKIVLERQAQLLKDDIKSYYINLIEEKMPMMEKAIMEVCIEYIRICNLEIELLPNNVFELLLLILEQDKSNTYQQSFLFSIQLICADYLEIIDAGRPIIGSVTSELDDQFMEIVLDRKNKILDIEYTNLNLLEQTKMIVKLCTFLNSKQQGPLPLVRYRKRNDV